MFKPLLILSAIIVCLSFTVNAQTDTSAYDLGRVSIKKQFTQSITIKGSDLERMQFSDLADAINVWLYGTYTNSATLVYVVNGVITTDVNSYSIFDVDEVTLVQNAIAQVSGAGSGQQLIFIKLKTNRPGKQGVEAAGQSSLVNLANRPYSPGLKSIPGVYNQYYLSGYKNLDAVQMGVSADYQRDVMPALTNNNYGSVNPLHFSRFKFSGYVNARLWRGTTANFGINYVPQQNRSSFNYDPPSYATGESDNSIYKNGSVQHFVSTNLSVNSHIIKGLTNTLSAAFIHYNYFEADSIRTLYLYPGDPNQNTKTFVGADDKTSNLLLRDNLAYHTKAGVFDIEPAVNFSYRKFKDSYRDSTETLNISNGPSYYSLNTESGAYDTKLYLLTPSVNLAYKDLFNLQGGFVTLLNSSKDFNSIYKLSRFFPFLSTSVNVFKCAGVNDMSLQVFGSFSRQNPLLDDPYSTLDGFGLTTLVNQGSIVTFTGAPGYPIYPNAFYNPLRLLNNYQAGLVLGLTKNLSISYNIRDAQNAGLLPVYVPYGVNGSELVYVMFYSKEIMNRIGLNYSFYSDNFTWKTGLNAAQEKFQADGPSLNEAYATYLNTGHRYSGGFTNRFTYKNIFAGLDILYQLGQRPITLDDLNPIQIVAPPHVNSVSLQSLYFGSQIKINKVKYAEIFASFRNIAQNNSGDITDNRRFYGLGVKVGW